MYVNPKPFIYSPAPLSALVTITLFSRSVCLFLFCNEVHSYHFFFWFHIYDIIWHLSLSEETQLSEGKLICMYSFDNSSSHDILNIVWALRSILLSGALRKFVSIYPWEEAEPWGCRRLSTHWGDKSIKSWGSRVTFHWFQIPSLGFTPWGTWVSCLYIKDVVPSSVEEKNNCFKNHRVGKTWPR